MRENFDRLGALLVKLFEPENRRLNQMLISLNQQNKEIRKSTIDGFLYLGGYYIPAGIPATIAGRGQDKNTLHFSLYPEMDRYLTHKKNLDRDIAQIRQILVLLTQQANSPQEYRDALPECLVPLDPEAAKLPRFMRHPTWLIQSNKRALIQYEHTLPRIEFYAATRLIY